MNNLDKPFIISIVAMLAIVIIFVFMVLSVNKGYTEEHTQRIFSECVKHASVAECYQLIK
jgi:ABC-type lipoprotein release transport system permease subunit